MVRALHNEVHELHYSIWWVDLVPFVDDEHFFVTTLNINDGMVAGDVRPSIVGGPMATSYYYFRSMHWAWLASFYVNFSHAVHPARIFRKMRGALATRLK